MLRNEAGYLQSNSSPIHSLVCCYWYFSQLHKEWKAVITWVCSSYSCYGLTSTNNGNLERKQGGWKFCECKLIFIVIIPNSSLCIIASYSFLVVWFCVSLDGLFIRLWWWCSPPKLGITEIKGDALPPTFRPFFQILSQLFSFLPENLSNDFIYLFVYGLPMLP